MTIHSGIIVSNYCLWVSGGDSATSTTVNPGGDMWVSGRAYCLHEQI